MPAEIVRGKPLPDLVERLRGHVPKAALIFIIDGCRADALYDALATGKMPNLKRLMEDVGYARYDSCFTVFPSVTIACHTSIVTGTHPGDHGIVGNEWFIRKNWRYTASVADRYELFRATREYVKWSWLHWRSDPGLANGFFTGGFFGIANADMYETVSTIYEAYNRTKELRPGAARSVSIFEMVTRGTDVADYIDTDDVKALMGGQLQALLNWLKETFGREASYSFKNKGLDKRAIESLVTFIHQAPDDGPGVYVVWLPGMDGFSHEYGASKQGEYFKHHLGSTEKLVGQIDKEFANLRAELERRNLLKDVLICVTADHGQYDCEKSDDKVMTNVKVYQHLRSDAKARAGEVFPLTEMNEIDEDCKDATVIAIGNGGACHIYISTGSDWSELPSIDRLRKFFDPLWAFPGTDLLFVRDRDNGYLWWDGHEEKLKTLDSLDNAAYPFVEERVNTFTNTERAGDIIISARPPYYFATHSMRGEHGTLQRDDSHVPLIFINSNLGQMRVEGAVRVIDIAPTIAAAAGCLEELAKRGTKKDKLVAILDTLQMLHESKLYTDGPDYIFNAMGSAVETNRIKRAWFFDESDMRKNFKIKVDTYRKEGKITEEDYRDLVARYEKITAEHIG